MRLRDHHIRKVRTGWRRRGWLVQPLKATDGEKLTRIVDTFAEAAGIVLHGVHIRDCRVVELAHDDPRPASSTWTLVKAGTNSTPSVYDVEMVLHLGAPGEVGQ